MLTKYFNITFIIVALIILASAFLVNYFQNKDLPSFAVYYGDKPNPILAQFDLAILEPDAFDLKLLPPSKTKYIGYLSLGEISNFRNYWPELRNHPMIIEENENWPGSFRIDIRNQEWRDRVLNQIIPDILAKGYVGIMLDTIDTAIYFEDVFPERFPGSRKALVSLIKEMRARFPKMEIITNNGFEVLSEIGSVIDGVLVEDLYTNYNFETKKYGKNSEEVRSEKEVYLDNFRASYNKPIFHIIYTDDKNSKLAKDAVSYSRDKSYRWYITNIELQSVGVSSAN